MQTPDTLKGKSSPRTSTPQIFPSSSNFENIAQISIVCDTVGSTINYTTDGSDPSGADALKYTAPFQIQKTTTIKAVATSNGVNSSRMVTKTYTKK